MLAVLDLTVIFEKFLLNVGKKNKKLQSDHRNMFSGMHIALR